MGILPPFLQEKKLHKVCLVLEGFEEYYYFDKILKFPCFDGVYEVKLINAKSASNVPAIYQEEFAKNMHEIVLVVCDKDRKPTQFEFIIKGLDNILGPGKAMEVVTFTSPCTLQVILSHFGDVSLTTQAKKAAQDVVKQFTGVDKYDAHQDQLITICSQIHYRTYADMKQRVSRLGTCPDHMPSSNILELLEHLESADASWISEINAKLSAEDD